jgi:hypothetical protein
MSRHTQIVGDPWSSFAGYNEKGMLSLYVNLICAVAYYAKVAMHLAGDPKSDYNLAYYTVKARFVGRCSSFLCLRCS